MTSARPLCLLFAVGCASPMSSLRADNRRLTQTVTELRTDRRTLERKLRDLQHQLDELRATSSVDGPVPVLPVEIAAPPAGADPAPGAARVVGVADDGTEIVYEGEAAATRPEARPQPIDDPAFARRRVEPSAPRTAALPIGELPATADRLEVTRRIPPISARAAMRSMTRDHELPGHRGGDAASDYRAAVELVRAGKHDDAVAALRAFTAQFPRHDYADNAQYWLGEAYYAQQSYPRAVTEFRKVIEGYPRGNKVPDALLKLGYCYQALGQGDKARAVLEQVVSLYPRSEPATLAARRLETP